MEKNQALPAPLITPTTKGGPSGHDERLTVSQVITDGYLDTQPWEQIQSAAIELFNYGQTVADRAGLILVDTKYEFGRLPDGEIILIDEIHTPDSSRFWLRESYRQCFEAGKDPDPVQEKEYQKFFHYK